jgi:hypothetical protein
MFEIEKPRLSDISCLEFFGRLFIINHATTLVSNWRLPSAGGLLESPAPAELWSP